MEGGVGIRRDGHNKKVRIGEEGMRQGNRRALENPWFDYALR